MIILGIDPGYDRMGVAVVKKERGKEKLLYSDCLTTKKNFLYGTRIMALGKELGKIIKRFKPDVVAMEKLFFFKNQKTALQVAEARGVFLYVAASNNVSIYELTPLQIKMALTGYGRADKRQVQKMVQAILKLEKIPKYDDEVDAIAAAIACPAQLSTVSK